jgi:hypothetical protein
VSRRRRLPAKLCLARSWVQANGTLCDIVCRGLLLALLRAGLIELPAVRMKPPNSVLAHRRVAQTTPIDQSPLVSTLVGLGPVEPRQVRRAGGEALFGQLRAHHHHLLESFIDPTRFNGTCYRAANWLCLGQSTGRGHRTPGWRPTRSLKQLWVCPLPRHFRQHLLGTHG